MTKMELAIFRRMFIFILNITYLEQCAVLSSTQKNGEPFDQLAAGMIEITNYFSALGAFAHVFATSSHTIFAFSQAALVFGVLAKATGVKTIDSATATAAILVIQTLLVLSACI
jgi:hypothetical protein